MAIKKSDIDQLLINAYNTRSGYVHNLKPLIKQISVGEIAKGDYLLWDNQPFLTFAGLARLTHHVILNFIMKQLYVEKEDYEWREDLPGMMTLPLAPQYWIWKHIGISQEHATDKFEALIDQLISEPYEVTDIRELLKKYEELIPQSKQKYKIQMLCTYLLYNSLIEQKARLEDHDKFIAKHESTFDICCIENMVTYMFLGIKWIWKIEECDATVNLYLKSRYKKNSLKVPSKLEVALFLNMSNLYLENQLLEKHNEWLRIALLDSPGQEELQNRILLSIENEEAIDISGILFNRITIDDSSTV